MTKSTLLLRQTTQRGTAKRAAKTRLCLPGSTPSPLPLYPSLASDI